MPLQTNSSRSVLVVGAGLVGCRRARIAARHPGSNLVGVCDVRRDRAEAATEGLAHAVAHTDWREALHRHRPDLTVISTPVGEQLAICEAALQQGADVLVEKPFGRNVQEARRLHDAAQRAGRRLAVGFNHRFHPALARAAAIARGGALGPIRFVRCVYGHGGRPGYEREWRTDSIQAGGGELLDQGVHVLDLLHWVLGPPARVFAELATLTWPIEVEDNAFGLLRYPDGATASFHVSWSQWQNRFQWQIYGAAGGVEVDGLGGSYGEPTVTVFERPARGGPPTRQVEEFAAADSWTEEWAALLAALDEGREPPGGSGQALGVMAVVDALYRSAATGRPIELGAAAAEMPGG